MIAGSLLTTANAFAAGPPVPSEASNPFAIVLLVVIITLLLIIGLLAYVLLGAAEISLRQSKAGAAISNAAKTVTIVALCLFSATAFAGDATSADSASQLVSTTVNGLSKFSYYTLLGVIGLELIVVLVMLLHVKGLLAKEKLVVVAEVKEAKPPLWKIWWAKINSFKPLNEVSDMGHDYDGIHELDNKLPPWWVYGFLLCILFSAVYLYRFQVSHTAPSTIEEYEIAMANAEVEKEEYLKHAASKVDENTVTLLTDAGDLFEGKKLFGSSCMPCHGAEAQGVVGPNLTDDYWLHKGGVKDVFKVIKYGVPEKGMKSWKDDFSPVQIAQLTSYIKSLHGSKPAGAKEPQGDLFKEDATNVSDTTKAGGGIAAN